MSPPADPAPAPATAAGATQPAGADPAPVDLTKTTDGDGSGGDNDSDGDSDSPDEEAEFGEPRKVTIDVRVLVAVAVAVVLLALIAGAYALGTSQGSKGTTAAPTSPSSTVFKMPKEFATLIDPDTGVKLSVPNSWAQYSTKDTPDKTLRFNVGIPDTGDGVLVRVNSYEGEITDANLGDQKNLIDKLLSVEKIQIFVNQPTKVGGLPALFYVYRFTDEASGKTGIHAHYFVFQGRKMVSLVFQALPEARYETLAPTFDLIINSLQVAPGPPPAFLEPAIRSTTTAAPGASATPGPTPPTTG